MRLVPVGAKGSFTLVVAPAHLASNFKDAMLPPVMIMIMENAALNASNPISSPAKARSAEASMCVKSRRRRLATVSRARPK